MPGTTAQTLASLGRVSIISSGFRLTLLAACLAALVTTFRLRHLRWPLVGAAMLATLLLGANLADAVNARYRYLPNVSSLWNGYRGADQNTWNNAQSARHQSVIEVSATRGAPPPAHGMLVEVPIPGIVSGFRGRAAQIYLPPAWTANPEVRPPVIVMLHGTPGSPLDWSRSAGVDLVSDRWAASHGGVAPILVMPDINGRFFADSECTNGRKGNVDTYLSVDVPAWIQAHLHPATGARQWAVGGLSEGGLCSINLTLRHPQVYSTFLDFAGNAQLTHQGGAKTLFDGTDATRATLVRSYDPLLLLAGVHRPNQVSGWFEVGTADKTLLGAARDMHMLAGDRGIDTHLVVIPHGGHDFRIWKQSFEDAYQWVAPRLIDASNSTPAIPGSSAHAQLTASMLAPTTQRGRAHAGARRGR